MSVMIHIADHQTDEILDYIPEEEYWADNRVQELKDNVDVFEFETFATEEYSGPLEKRNRLLFEDVRTGKMVEFIIEDYRQILDETGLHYKLVFASASYLELRKQKIIAPTVTENLSPKGHLDLALAGTDWEAGDVAHGDNHITTLTEYMDAYEYLLNVAQWSGLELSFEVEHNGYRITRRIVHLRKPVGTWRGYEVTFGEDLRAIERVRISKDIVTALIGIGPPPEEGQTRMEVWVEDEGAKRAWGRNGRHLIEVFQPETTDEAMSMATLTAKTQEELERRIKLQAQYTAKIQTLTELAGVEPGDLQFGDQIRLKDEEFVPPLYLEARIHTMEGSIKTYGNKEVTLGDYVEYSRSDVRSALAKLQDQINRQLDEATVIDLIEQNSGEAWVYSNVPPEDTTLKWVDTTKRPYIMKVWIESLNDWVKMAPTDPAEVGADPAGSAEAALNAAREDILEVSTELDGFRNEYNDFMADGFITRSEAYSIERHIQSISSEKSDVDSEFTVIYGNIKLPAANKTDLLAKKQAYDTAHNSLINTINTAIADGYATAAEASDVDNAFIAYATALGNYSTSRANATYAITAKEALDAKDSAIEISGEAALTAAQEAANLAELAAREYAEAQAEAARIAAEAFTDGVITESESALMEDAAAKLLEAKDYADTTAAAAVAAIDFSNMVNVQDFNAVTDELKTQLTTRGGANLLRNSIGFAGLDYWNSTTTSFVRTIVGDTFDNIGYGSGFHFEGNTFAKGIEQPITVTVGNDYTFSWMLKKTAPGLFVVEILENGLVVMTVPDTSSAGEDFTHNYVSFNPTTSNVTVRVRGDGALDAIVTGLMVGAGNLPMQWTLASGELYNAFVRADDKGVTVLRLDENGNISGKTVMSPEEFAGYYDANRDGLFEKVFWLNEDETVTKKIRALQEITMGTIKIVRIDSAQNRGWAFVPIVEDI